MTSTAIGFLMVAALLSTWTVSLNEFILTEWAPGGQSGQIIQLSRPLCETVVLCPCRRHTGNMTSTTRQQHVQTDPEKPSSSSRSCVMLSIQLTRTVAKSNSRDGEIDVCLVICFHDKEKKDKTKCHRVNTNYLVSSIRRGATVSLSLSIIIIIIPSSFCQCPIGRKRCGPNQSCAMIRFRHVVFYWFLSISGSLFFFSLRGQDCRQSSLWVMCHHSICRGRGGGGGYVRKVGRTAPPSGWIDPLLSSLTISRYPPVTDRTEYIYIYTGLAGTGEGTSGKWTFIRLWSYFHPPPSREGGAF